jgi:hypothetical protein
MGALDHPPATRLDRRRDPASGARTDHPALGQHLPTRLVVVAGIQVHHWPAGQPADPNDRVQVVASSPSSRWLAGAGTAASGMPSASTATERLT